MFYACSLASPNHKAQTHAHQSLHCIAHTWLLVCEYQMLVVSHQHGFISRNSVPQAWRRKEQYGLHESKVCKLQLPTDNGTIP